MNLRENVEWAKSLKPFDLNPTRGHIIESLRSMVISKAKIVENLTEEIDRNMLSIKEHIETLNRMGITQNEEEPKVVQEQSVETNPETGGKFVQEHSREKPKEEDKKTSPLIP